MYGEVSRDNDLPDLSPNSNIGENLPKMRVKKRTLAFTISWLVRLDPLSPAGGA